MTFKSLITASLALTLSALLGQVEAGWAWGWCPTVPLQSSFTISQYTGVWYEQYRDALIPYEYGDCVQAGYTLNSDGTVQVKNSLENPFTGSVDSVLGSAACTGAQCYVGFFIFRTGDYRVVSTDYTNYAVVYGCTNYFFFRFENTWVLTRALAPAASVMTTAVGEVTTNLPFYSQSNWHATKQGGSCVYGQ